MATGYHPRRFDQSPLFQVVYHHFDHFREAYHRHYADYLGHLRPIVTHTINRFLLCGDPREGVARYDCPHCNHSAAVPFSCKTRLFCPSCHDLNTLLWIEAMFKKADGDLLRTRLAYAFRPPVALGRMDFDGTTVTVRTQKKQLLQLSPIEFLAKLTTHIPDRYQNIRWYAGFYASVVQSRVRREPIVCYSTITYKEVASTSIIM